MAESFGSSLTGIAGYRPGKPVTNDMLAPRTTVTPEWIVERTGIQSRYHAAPDEDIVTMAAEAGRKAIAMADVDTGEVDLLILATATRRKRMPGGAPQVATMIGLPVAGAFDLNAVCAGFTYALAMASNAVRTGDARHVLVVGAERTSEWINPATPDTFVIFGDGAGAAVVSRSEANNIGPAVWGSDGGRAGVLGMTEFGPGEEYVTMDGPLVYKWSTAKIPPVARRACERAGVSLTDVNWLVPHQANRRIIDTLARTLQVPDDHVARDVVDTGNTSAASVPLALSRLYESGRMSPGDLVLLLGFGAGLTYSGQVVRMP
jgi:3-oxoacyl-[acyl-carrier-protein] synthase-3